MASADECRATIDANRDALRDALMGAGASWDQAPSESDDEEQWSARQVAEHVIGAERSFAGMIAAVTNVEAPERQDHSFATVEEAIAELEAAINDANKVLLGLSDDDLAIEARAIANFPPSVEGLLQLTAYHLEDHSRQIAAASA